MRHELQTPKRGPLVSRDPEEREDAIDQRIERRELRKYRHVSLARQVEDIARTAENLSRAVAETNERHSRSLAAFAEHANAQRIERERAMLETLHGLLAIAQQHTHGASEASTQQVRQIEHLVDRVRAEQDWVGVVREVVAQSGAVAQQLLGSRGRAAEESPPRETTKIELEAPRHERPPTGEIPPSVALSAVPLPTADPAALLPAVPDAVAPDSQYMGGSDSKEDSDFFAQFFGFSECEPVSAQPCSSESANPHATGEPHRAPTLDPAEAPTFVSSTAHETVSEYTHLATEQSDPSPAVRQSLAALSAPSAEGGEPMDPAAMLDLLSRLMAQHAPKRERPRPKEWSRAWAIQELKRRVLDLGEMGFLTTVTQPRRLLLFVRELGEAIRPPDLRPLPAPA